MALVFGGLVILGGIITAALPGPSTHTCTYACIAPSGPVVPSGQVWSGPGVSLSYPQDFTEQSSNQVGANVVFTDQGGDVVWVWVGQGDQSLSSLVSQYASKLNLQSVTDLGPMFGSEIGFVNGTGEFYSAVISNAQGQTVNVGFGAEAARSGNTWAVFIGGGTCSQNASAVTCTEAGLDSQAQNLGNSQAIDGLLVNWKWGS